jgi:uncharacterized protein involved in response to NO
MSSSIDEPAARVRVPSAGGLPPPDAAAARWRWRTLLDAPHRLAFAAAAFVLASSALWWAAASVARAFGAAWPWAVAPALAHGLLFGYGFMPLFFTGFLFTAGPRWLQRPPVAARALLVPVAVFVGGWLLFGVAAQVDARLAAAGLALVAAAFAAITGRFVRLLRASRAEDRLHARVIAVGCGIVCVALALAALGLAVADAALARAAMLAGVWGGIALVHVTALHRMVPFFGAAAWPLLDAWRPAWLLALLSAGLAFEAARAAAEAFGWPSPPAWRAPQAAVEAVLALLLLGLALRWLVVQHVARLRLVAMLHAGFVWLGLAFALQSVSHALMAAGEDALGLAPLHALTIGFFGSTFLAMVTRVTHGQAGRSVAADDGLWLLFWLLQCAALARVAAALWPAAAAYAMPLAALLWAGCMTGWAWRYGRDYGRPRLDRRAGSRARS